VRPQVAGTENNNAIEAGLFTRLKSKLASRLIFEHTHASVGQPYWWTEALIVNLLLMSLFAVQHSLMARKQFKQWWTQYVPKSVERSTYVLFASLALMLLFWQWRPMPAVVWSVADPDIAVTVTTVSLGGWMIVFTSTFLIHHFELFGLHQVANNLAGREMPAPRFRPRCITSSFGTRSISASSSRSGQRRR
jgi:protein-S-isoprenylcysteine O-methyltransferase Ste14